jgi:hypothetical protein
VRAAAAAAAAGAAARARHPRTPHAAAVVSAAPGAFLPLPLKKVVTELLKEMNESVAGSYVETSPEGLVDADPSFLDRFDLVIATQARGLGVLWAGGGGCLRPAAA